uniref:uncharacterized protein LOC120327934 isoform X1 n=1 Tax=Styela clava TaxID=7725 RepID=UPI0019393443|nr:uncharacterized protein LOC120327934 isoform X1 [Styela clava]
MSNQVQPMRAQPQQPATMTVQAPPPDVPNRVCASVINMLLCCPPLGLVALIFACQANSAKSYNVMEARSKADTAKTLNIVGFILGILAWIAVGIYLFVFFYFLAGVLNAYGNVLTTIGEVSNSLDELSELGNSTSMLGNLDLDIASNLTSIIN